ncbi:MAG: hypothetical protein HY616_02450, partial [Candidatus Rokubacteria bacterium]|nr:hypothetical protein [Candidatus Rokubacteria bacterium]
MTFRESARETSLGASAPGALAGVEDTDTRIALDEDAEETPRAASPIYEALPAKSEDPVRLYL